MTPKQPSNEELRKILVHLRNRLQDGFNSDLYFKDATQEILALIQSERKEAERLALKEPNDLLRSAYQIALRGGKDTNWQSVEARLADELEREHKIMYPNTEQEQS